MACRLLGHRFRFASDDHILQWQCARGCEAEGHKQYPNAATTSHYARVFDHEDWMDLGRRPTLSLLPLWLVRKARAGPDARRASRARDR